MLHEGAVADAGGMPRRIQFNEHGITLSCSSAELDVEDLVAALDEVEEEFLEIERAQRLEVSMLSGLLD